MFDFGFSEIFLLSLVALIVLGPSRLPEVMRTCGLWLGRARRIYNNVRLEIEREVGMDDIRRQLHNEQIMSELDAVEKEARTFKRDIENSAPTYSELNMSTQENPADTTHRDDSQPSNSAQTERNLGDR